MNSYSRPQPITKAIYLLSALCFLLFVSLQVTAARLKINHPVLLPLTSGVMSPTTETIEYNAVMTQTMICSSATGGNGTYAYHWQLSTDNSTWTDITGGPTTSSYLSPYHQTFTIYYRVASTSAGITVFSNSCGVFIKPLTSGTISPLVQYVNYNGPAGAITCTAATGYNGTYAYNWQISTDNSTWTDIAGGPSTLSYTPNYAHTYTLFYRMASASNGITVFSQSSAVYINNCGDLTHTSSAQNYIQTTIPRGTGYGPGTPGPCSVPNMQTIQYSDGLGRPVQVVQEGASVLGKDIVQPLGYDSYGREVIKFLPYATTTNDGSFRADAIQGGAGVFNFYRPGGIGNSGDQQSNGVVINPYPYAQTVFEPTPLNRPVEQGSPGASWQITSAGVPGGGHTVKTVYDTNSSEVLAWTVNATGNGATSTAYGAGELYKTVMTDENGNNTTEYSDNEGQVICKMAQNGASLLTTYYVYDDFHRLAYIIPPTQTVVTSFLETDANFVNFIYGYHYDERGRVSEKHMPAKGWTFMIYNNQDQLIFSQDANQRNQNPQVWQYTKYDAQGRIAITGLWVGTGYAADNNLVSPNETLHQWLIGWAVNATLWVTRDNTNSTGYNIVDPPGPILTINYYDDYTFPGNPYPTTTLSGTLPLPKGMPTATRTTVLNTLFNTSPDMLWSVIYYDSFGRDVQTFKQHYLNSTLNTNNRDVVTTTLNFNNQPTTIIRQHYTSSSPSTPAVTITNSYSYDNSGRKTATYEQINGGTNILLSKTDYNEIDQPKTKYLHSTTGASFLQTIGYTYNERGWLSKLSSGLFEEQLQYDKSQISGITPAAQYNGNIASQSWGTAAAPNSQSYNYTYDPLNRLTAGNATNGNTESGIDYDNLGNINHLNRYVAGTLTDQLTYNYLLGGVATNQLQSITDQSAVINSNLYPAGTFSYGYDPNGSMTSDGSRNTITTYNLFNNVQSVTLPVGTITYSYDANGNKIQRKDILSGTTTTIDYVDGIQYNNGSLNFVQTEEGRILNLTGTPNYEYGLKDHLGSTRRTFDSALGAGTAKQADDYYPSGTEIATVIPSLKNEYLYNSKELQEPLKQYDYGARSYDPLIERFTSVDAYSDKYSQMTPYQYGALNPISNIDMNGDSVWTTSSQIMKNGDTYIRRTTHITGKVIDETGGGGADALATGVNARLNNSAGSQSIKNADGSQTFISYDIDAQFTVAHSVDEIEKSDNVLAIVDNITGKSADGVTSAAGITNQKFGRIAYVGITSMKNLVDVGYHEVGHELGFDDHFDGDKTDPMDYKGGIYGGIKFNNNEMISIYENNNAPFSRKMHGYNRAIITNRQNDGVYNNISTNEQPYKGDRTYGMHILLPVNNK